MDEISRLLILYGSQTFTAQESAERIWRTMKTVGFKGPVQAMDNYPISQLIHERFVLFVCATTGQGDEPDNMKKFWRFLLRKNLPSNSLCKVKFGVIGLGDSSYPKFNFVAKKLHKRLLQLGAEPLIDIGLCDYQHDLGHDAVLVPWVKNFLTTMKTYFPNLQTDITESAFIPKWKVSLLKNTEYVNGTTLSNDIYYEKGHTNQFLDAIKLELKENKRTTEESHFQDVRLIKFKTVDNNNIDYQPGDIFNIRPRNSKEDIEDLFDIFLTHNLDIKPYYRLLVEVYHDGLRIGRPLLFIPLGDM